LLRLWPWRASVVVGAAISNNINNGNQN